LLKKQARTKLGHKRPATSPSSLSYNTQEQLIQSTDRLLPPCPAASRLPPPLNHVGVPFLNCAGATQPAGGAEAASGGLGRV